jgi:hypothetical protein
MMIATHAQQLRTKHDTNGNPRRAWLLIEGREGGCVGVIDEGYAGKPTAARGLVELPPIEVPPSEYHRWMRYGRRLDTEAEQAKAARMMAAE